MKCTYCGHHCIEDARGGCYCEFCGAHFTEIAIAEEAQRKLGQKKEFKAKLPFIITISVIYVISFLVQFFILLSDPWDKYFGFFGLIGILPGVIGLKFCFTTGERLMVIQENSWIIKCLLTLFFFPCGILLIIIGTPSLEQLRIFGIILILGGLLIVLFPLIVYI